MKLYDEIDATEAALRSALMSSAHALDTSARLGTVDDRRAAISSTIDELSTALQAHALANREGAAALRRMIAARDVSASA